MKKQVKRWSHIGAYFKVFVRGLLDADSNLMTDSPLFSQMCFPLRKHPLALQPEPEEQLGKTIHEEVAEADEYIDEWGYVRDYVDYAEMYGLPDVL